MGYYRLLQLEREPFSNSPDPELFFKSRQHQKCLQALEISLRLKRGLNVVCGDVGTGKTTICRRLVRIFRNDDHIKTHLILDPTFENASVFLKTVGSMLLGSGAELSRKKDPQIREMIKQSLFQEGVNKKNITVLIIDEGQKISVDCLELLRELLNYETNEYKLLQIVIFAQREFETVLNTYENFADRINLIFQLGPLSVSDTRKMIEYRIARSSAPENSGKLFDLSAMLAIYIYSGGYPRKIVNLCHKITLAMIIKEKKVAGWMFVRSVVQGGMHKKAVKKFGPPLLFLLIVLGIAGYLATDLQDYPEVENRAKHLYSLFSTPVINTLLGRDNQYGGISFLKSSQAPPQYYKISSLPKKSQQNLAHNSSEVMASEIDDALAIDTPVEEKITAKDVQAVIKVPVNTAGAVPDERLPHFWGSVVIKKGETLSEMLRILYGAYKNSYLRSVVNANITRIGSDGTVAAGTKIRFPVLSESLTFYNSGNIFIEIGLKNNLEEAVEFCRTCRSNGVKTRVLPFWNTKDKRICFAVVLNKFFQDRQTALFVIEKLPEDFQSLSQIRHWEG